MFPLKTERMVEFVKALNSNKIRRLWYIWFLHFLLYVNSLKKFLEQDKT